MVEEKLELYKKQAKRILLIGLITGIILTILLLIVVILTKAILLLFFEFFIIITVIIVTFVLYSIPYGKYKSLYKDYYVKSALESIFSNLVYKPDCGIEKKVIQDTNMLDMGDRYRSNDYISGKYKNINVEQADVHIEKKEERKDSDGNTKTEYDTIFRGKWMIFDFNKSFKANMQVKEKSFSHSKINNWGSDLKFEKVLLEDQDFNNRFKVYAQDPEEAFYILTPHFMDKIKKVSDSVSGDLLFCFIDNRLHVGLNNNRDSFEPSLLSNRSEDEIKNSILSDIKVITEFVDQLNLDNDLFKKEV